MNRLCCIILVIFFINSICVPQAAANTEKEVLTGYFTIADEAGKIILQTGHLVQVGDEIISEDNGFYEIISVKGTSAKARKVYQPNVKNFSSAAISAQAPGTPPAPAKKPVIAIYHTHTDESYIPTDGKDSKPGNGSIMRVGDTLASSLRNLGYEVEHSTALHDPHDANAYHRSRRTALKLLKKHPVAMFDVHRDSAPLENYQVEIDGRQVAKILLVVGKQNQNRLVTQEFAQIIKILADSMQPGLIRGIFIAKGNYNQDLSPRSILVEIGTESGSLESAQVSAALFAGIIPPVLALSDKGSTLLESSSLTPPDSYGRQLSPDSTSAFFTAVPVWSYFILACLMVAAIGLYFYLRKR